MATAARKARKRAGIKFEKAAKIPTPVLERSYLTQLVSGPTGTRLETTRQPRSAKKAAKFLEGRTLSQPEREPIDYIENNRFRRAKPSSPVANTVV